MYDKCQLMLEYGLEVIWASFVDGVAELESWSYDVRNGVHHIRVGKELSKQVVEHMVDHLEPDFVYTTDVVMETVTRVCFQRQVPIITCWHFWHPGIKLGPQFNRQIMNNHHTIDDTLHPLRRMSTKSYVCSEFVQQVFLKVSEYPKPRVIPSVPQNRIIVANRVPTYVVMANLHSLKGGEIFLELVKRHNIPLWGLYPERDTEKRMPEQIIRAAEGKSHVRLDKRVDDMTRVYSQARLVICPSIVDETFGRVAMESVANRIPLLVANTGNLKYLFPDEEFYLDPHNPGESADRIASLTDEELHRIQEKQQDRYKHICYNYKQTFFTLLDDTLHNKETTMIFCLWADHGIGIQARTYVRAFEEEGIPTSIFSYTSYVKEREPWHRRKFQADSKEWYHPRCYYSPNVREKVTDKELESFVREYNVKTCVIIETCWFRIFEIAKFMRSRGITAVAVPNAELVRSDEIEKHNNFDVLACNNQQAMDLFQRHSKLKHKARMLGFPVFFEPAVSRTGPIKLLLVGGLTGARRKNTPLVSRVFSHLQIDSESTTNLRLTITGQTKESLGDVVEHENITYITGNLRHGDIERLYYEHDIVIIVSEHEGLGLSFFEAMKYGCPIVTVNHAPHNEIVKHGVNGWLLDADEIETRNNPYPMVKSAAVKADALKAWFSEINTIQRKDLEKLRQITHAYNQDVFGKEPFMKRWESLFE